MKDLSLSHNRLEHHYAKSSSTPLLTKKDSDHGYAKSSAQSSTKKVKKAEVIDPKQRKLSFAKVPSLHKVEVTYVSSDSDEPLSSIKSVEADSLGRASDKSSNHSVNGLKDKVTSKSPVKDLPPGDVAVLPSHLQKDGDSKKIGLWPKPKKTPTLIQSPGFSRKNSIKKRVLMDGDKEEKKKKKKVSNGKKLSLVKKESPSTKKRLTPDSGKKHKKGLIPLPSDSDSDLDVPLSKLKTSPKSDTKKYPVKPLKSKRSLSMSERSPKVKISHSKSPKIKEKKEFKQRTLFDFGKQTNKGSAFAQNRFSVSSEKGLKSLEVVVNKIDWKGLSEAEREKIRLQKREEWNRVRREKKRMLNQRYDDLELSNISPLPQAKPINLQGGLCNAAFGDIAMIVEFIYCYSKFLAPEETPTITAELLIKALAAGSQGANVISKIVLVFLRTLIGEEEREINGLGIGLADMPLTTFTVSELLYHYLRLTCEMPVKEKDDDNDDDDDDDDASSVSSVANGVASQAEMPRKIIDKLEKSEIYTLPASDQLKVLLFLFYKIIDSEYFLDYLENLKIEAKELWRQQDAFRKKAAKERKEEQSKNVESKTQSPSDVIKIDQFTKKLEPGAKTNEQKQGDDMKPTKALIVSKGAESLEARKELKNEEVKSEKTSEEPKVVGSGQKEVVDLDSKVNEDMMKDYPKEPVADLVHIVRQRRAMAAKQAALKDEEERKDKERRSELDELRQKTRKVQAWKDGLDRCKKSLRLEPIGVDRHFKLYWVFSQGMPGIYVEDGYMYYDARENRTIDSWECYDTVQDIDRLLKALAKQGVRESALKACISNQYKHITSMITKKNREHFELQPYDVFEESIKVLKEDLLESGNKIVKGALGVILNHEGWEKKVEEAKTLEEMTPLLLDLQQSVMPKFLEGAMSQSKGEQVVQNWRDNVKQVKTMSALHTLLGILENSVKWDKSAENAKCKICRRKGGDDYLILCDECNRAYHPYCLRPALIDFPVSNWKCPACAPSLPLSRSRTRRKEEQIDYDETGRDDDSGEDEEKEEEKEQGDDEDDSDHEDQCHVCGEDGELICCDQCPKVYHLDCHEPPIRRLPRGIWICFVCRNPKMATRLRRTQEDYEKAARQRNRASREKKQSRGTMGKLSSERRRRTYRDEEGDESESSGSGSGVQDETEEEIEEKQRRGSRGGRKSKRKGGGSSVEESGGEEESSRKGRQKSRRRMPQKRRSSNTGDESSEPSPKSKKRRRTEPLVDEEPITKRSRRRSRPLSENDGEDDAEEPVSKRPTRRRKLRESEENVGETEREDGRNSSSKRRNSGELSFGRRSRNRNRGQNSEIVACENILKGMWKCKSAYHFRNPVDFKKVPDYGRFVTNPMDLSRIRDKLEMLEYEDAFQFADDVKLIFENSRRYNEDASDVGQEAKDLEKEFYKLLRQNLPGLHSSLSEDN